MSSSPMGTECGNYANSEKKKKSRSLVIHDVDQVKLVDDDDDQFDASLARSWLLRPNDSSQTKR